MHFRAWIVFAFVLNSQIGFAGDRIRITREGIQTCYQGASSIGEVIKTLEDGKDLAPLDPTPIVPTESEDPESNSDHWKLPNQFAFNNQYYLWLPADEEKIPLSQFPYGKITFGSGSKFLNYPHIQGTSYRFYTPKDADARGLVQVQEKHGSGSIFSSKPRYYPAFAFQKYSLWKFKENPDEIFLVDHANDQLHLVWKKFKTDKGGGDYWYNTITDQIWSPEYEKLNIGELEAKANRLDLELGVDGFRIPSLADYRMGAEMSQQHILPGYDDDGMYLAFGQLAGPVQYWVADNRDPNRLGSFYADEHDILDDHWEKREKLKSSTSRRARLVTSLLAQSPEVQANLRQKYKLEPMAKDVAENILKRRHDPRAVIPRKK